MHKILGAFLSIVVFTAVFASYFVVEHPSSLFANEENTYIVGAKNKVTQDPVVNATVELVHEGTVLAEMVTNDAGYAMFYLMPSEAGKVLFRISAEGYNDYVIVQEITGEEIEAAQEEAGELETEETGEVAVEPVTGLVTADTEAATGFVTADEETNWTWIGFIAVVLVVIIAVAYFVYSQRMDEEAPVDEEASDASAVDVVESMIDAYDEEMAATSDEKEKAWFGPEDDPTETEEPKEEATEEPKEE